MTSALTPIAAQMAGPAITAIGAIITAAAIMAYVLIIALVLYALCSDSVP